MTRVNIIVFVEGWADRFFYDRLVNAVCGSHTLTYQIRTAKELGRSGDGKPALVSLFRLLRRRRALYASRGKGASAFFFLDKDIDDLLGNMITSRHVAYTEHYHVENYYFIAGDLVLASAAAASLEADTVREVLGDPRAWRSSVAAAWKEWVQLCLHAALHCLSCGCHFRTHSKVHKGCFGGIDGTRYVAALSALERASGLSADQFRERHTEICALVDRLYAEGRHDSVFSGRWYGHFLQATIVAKTKDRRSKARELSRRITDSLLPTIGFDDAWSENLRRPLARLGRRLRGGLSLE